MTTPARRSIIAPSSLGGGRETAVTVYDGMPALAAHLDASSHDMRISEYVNHRGGGRLDTWQGRGWSEALYALRNGDNHYVPASEALLAKVEAALPWEARKGQQVRAWDGSRLHMGAYLTGQPMPTMKRKRQPSPLAPLTIVAMINAAGAVSGADLIKRGTAIFALARVMAARRPTTLWAGAFGQTKPYNAGMLVRVDTAPLSLAHAGFMFCDPAAARTISWAARTLAHDSNQPSGWPPIGGSWHTAKRLIGPLAMYALHQRPDADVLYVPMAGDDGIADPVAWVVSHVAKYSLDPDKAA